MNTDNNTRDLTGVAEKARVMRDGVRGVIKALRTSDLALPRSTTLTALAALHNTGKHIYAGTADPVDVAARRKANKVARTQRRVNRSRNFRKGVR